MKKQINIVLIIAVLALWGTVGYRYIKNYFFVPTHALSVANTKMNIKSMNIKRDTFLLQPISRDPFLNKTWASAATPSSFTVNKTHHYKPAEKQKPVVNKFWPEINYYGYIKSGKNLELALMKINGKIIRMHKGESNNNILIKGIYKDSVSVLFNKEKKVFIKK